MTKLTDEDKKIVLEREIKSAKENLFVKELQFDYYTTQAGLGKHVDTNYLNQASNVKQEINEFTKFVEHLERKLSTLKITGGDVKPLEHIEKK